MEKSYNVIAFGFIAVAVLATLASADMKDDVPVVYGYMSDQKCPAKHFYNDCNRCFCSNDGYNAGCTRMGCSSSRPGSVPEKPLYAPNYKPGDKCPDKYFYDGCNNCICSKNGVLAACTLKFCIQGGYQ